MLDVGGNDGMVGRKDGRDAPAAMQGANRQDANGCRQDVGTPQEHHGSSALHDGVGAKLAL